MSGWDVARGSDDRLVLSSRSSSLECLVLAGDVDVMAGKLVTHAVREVSGRTEPQTEADGKWEEPGSLKTRGRHHDNLGAGPLG